jgi:hypothetical protein
MSESYEATLTLWPATTLTASVAEALLEVSVDLCRLDAGDKSPVLYRTSDGEIALELTFEDSPYGITDLEIVLATLRIAGVAYVAWDTKKGELAGTGRSFDPRDAVERQFTVLAGGEPVLIARDLDAFEHYGTAEALLHEVRRWLALPLPERAEIVSPAEVTIAIHPDAGEGER